MTKKEKAQYIMEELEKLYPETPVPLDHKDPYTLLIAVLLSAQCTDERVNKITPILFKLDSDVHKQPLLDIRRSNESVNDNKYTIDLTRSDFSY